MIWCIVVGSCFYGLVGGVVKYSFAACLACLACMCDILCVTRIHFNYKINISASVFTSMRFIAFKFHFTDHYEFREILYFRN